MAAILKKSAAILDFQVAHRADLTSSPQRTFVPNLVLVSQFARLVPLSALLVPAKVMITYPQNFLNKLIKKWLLHWLTL